MFRCASSFKVARTRSGLMISTCSSQTISPAVTTHSPEAETLTTLGPSQFSLADRALRFRMISVTSSLTPGTVENSCNTPSMRTDETATPGNEESKTLRSELPRVVPKPRSSGSMTNFPYLLSALISTHSILGFSISIMTSVPPHQAQVASQLGSIAASKAFLRSSRTAITCCTTRR